MNAREVFNLIAPLKSRVLGLVQLAELKLSKETTKLRELQLRIDKRTTPDDYPHFEPYGLTSRAKAGAEAVVLHVGGDRSVPVVICVSDRRYRIELADGEVALYDDQGAYLKLSRTGIVVEPAATQTVELGSGATLGVARTTDSVEVSSGSLFTSIASAAGSLVTAGADPVLLVAAPAAAGALALAGSALAHALQGTGTITSASATVKAVD